MRILKRTVIVLLAVVVILALGIVAARLYNNHKYPATHSAEYFRDPTNLDAYPQELGGVEITQVNDGTLHGFHLKPKDKKHPGVIVSYGGSEGAAGFDDAAMLAAEGYETLAVFMFGMEGQPAALAEVPLEQFDDVLGYIDSHTDGGPISVIGTSKGAEYALNLATKYDEISALVLRAPSAYNFAGLDFSQDSKSSWTWKGQPLPFIDIRTSNGAEFVSNVLLPMITGAPIEYLPTYVSAVEEDKDRASKLIPVQDTSPAILLIAGGDDKMWDSAGAAELIHSERPENTIVKVYPDAGHIFSGNGVLSTPKLRMRVGGTEESNAAAAKDSQEAILDFFSQQSRT